MNVGQYYLVGESGPELFIPSASGTIVPNAGPPAPMPAQGGGWGQGAVRATPRGDGGVDLQLYLNRHIDHRVDQSFRDRGALPPDAVRRS